MTSLLPTRSTALIAAAAVMLAATAAAAHDFTLGALTLDHPWARASAGPARHGAAFLAIENAGDADRLLGATGDIAERIELHKIGRASCRKECVSTCRSRWSP